MAFVVGTAILGSAVAATTVGIIVTYAVGYLAITAVTSIIMKALMPKSSAQNAAGGAGARGYTVNSQGSAQDHQIIYGEVKVGGAIVYDESTGADNKFFHRIIAIAGHEVDSFVEFYANEELLTVNGNGNVDAPAKYNQKMRIQSALGTDNQLANSSLISETSHWTNTCKLSGIAYIYARFEYDQDAYPNGIPTITAVVRGKKVYDPRTSTTAWSSNPALCIRDYLKSSYGLSEADAKIDDTAIAIAANICDASVTNSISAPVSTSTRYTCNGSFTTAVTPYDTLSNLVGCMGGKIWYGQGKWQVKPAYWTEPVMDITNDDFRSGIGVSTRHSRRDNFNTLTGTFRGAESDWQVTDYPSVTNSAFLAADGGQESVADVPLTFTVFSLEASRLGLIALEANRQQLTVSASFGLRTLQLQIGDNVRITNTRFGWDNKEFEVQSWSFGLTDGLDLQVDMVLRETAQAIYNQTYDGVMYERDNTTLPSAFDVPSVGMSLDTSLRNTNQTVVAVLEVVLSATSVFIDKYEVEYKLSSATEFIALGSGSGLNYELIYTSDATFDIRARAINTFGVRGVWTTTTNYGARPFSVPPANVAGMSANVNQTTAVLSWEPVPDLDLSHYEIRFTRETVPVWSNSVLLIDKVARPATSITVAAQTGTYLIKAVDKLDNKSVAAIGTTVAITAADTVGLNSIKVVTENPSFSGVKTHTRVVENALELLEGQESGTYEFHVVEDLLHVYTSYVESFIDIVQLNFATTFEAPTENFDLREGLFDGDPAAYDGSTAVVQVATTLNDPTSTSAVFTDFNNLSAGSYNARGFKFRALLTTNNLDVAPKITRLQVKIDMPDVIQSGDDLEVTGSEVVLFPSPFHSQSNPAISTSVTGLGSGDYVQITAKTHTGFTITVRDSSNTPLTTATQLDYVARGFGKET